MILGSHKSSKSSFLCHSISAYVDHGNWDLERESEVRNIHCLQTNPIVYHFFKFMRVFLPELVLSISCKNPGIRVFGKGDMYSCQRKFL